MIELLDLAARWIHVIAAIMWVGNSMLFNWLDRNLRPGAGADVYGDIWLLHSGGFYLVEKNKGERSPSGVRSLPQPLHWFKWQAYTTWITGAALLVVVYYLGGRALLVDPAVAGISHATGTWIAIATIVGAFLLYEVTWRLLGDRAPRVAGLVSLVALVAVVELLLARLSGRAAWLHVGALLATIMAGNVAFTIIPSQRELVDALKAGREPSQVIADRAKTRSIHNNYITFPVIALMVSAHFPSLYARPHSDLALFTLIAGGALVRHILNVRFDWPAWRLPLAGTIAGTVVVLAALMGILMPNQAGSSTGVVSLDSLVAALPTVTFDDARRVIDRRCAACHSAAPSDISLGVRPGGVAFDTPDQIIGLSPRIKERAVTTQTMPPGNKTRITAQERAILAKWIAQGSQVR